MFFTRPGLTISGILVMVLMQLTFISATIPLEIVKFPYNTEQCVGRFEIDGNGRFGKCVNLHVALKNSEKVLVPMSPGYLHFKINGIEDTENHYDWDSNNYISPDVCDAETPATICYLNVRENVWAQFSYVKIE